MNYQETIDFLYLQLPAYQKIGQKAFKKNLNNIILLCDALGNPHNKFKSIHIAGTNGKGSTAHMLASIFHEEGFKVGLYTSPHLIDFRERIKINGNYIHKNSVIHFVKKIKPLILKLKPSFFEITVAMAFYHFANKKVDIAIIETGLGGRLDSTNIIQPILSIITNISLEHQNFLGNTLKQIASEKAGIIKATTPVVIGEIHPETKQVFKAKAKDQNSEIYFAENMFHTNKVDIQLNYTSILFSYSYNNNSIKIKSSLKGPYQIKNIITILATIKVLSIHLGIKITKTVIQNGLRKVQLNTNFLGRWQTIKTSPRVIVDCAHNAAGIASVFENQNFKEYQNLRIIYGCVSDKDVNKIVELLPKNAIYYVTQPSVERAKPVEETSEFFIDAKLNVVNKGIHPIEMLNKAIKDANENDLVLVIGSIFLVADILESYK